MTRIIEVRPLQVYFCSYFIQVTSTITTKCFVSGTANDFINTCLLLSLCFPSSCLQQSLPRTVYEPHLSTIHGHISNQTQTALQLIYAENFRGLLFTECPSGDTVTTLSQKQAESLCMTNPTINLTPLP
jgi:hypothetical protein